MHEASIYYSERFVSVATSANVASCQLFVVVCCFVYCLHLMSLHQLTLFWCQSQLFVYIKGER